MCSSSACVVRKPTSAPSWTTSAPSAQFPAPRSLSLDGSTTSGGMTREAMRRALEELQASVMRAVMMQPGLVPGCTGVCRGVRTCENCIQQQVWLVGELLVAGDSCCPPTEHGSVQAIHSHASSCLVACRAMGTRGAPPPCQTAATSALCSLRVLAVTWRPCPPQQLRTMRLLHVAR